MILPVHMTLHDRNLRQELGITNDMIRRGVAAYFAFDADLEEPENLVAVLFDMARSEWMKTISVPDE